MKHILKPLPSAPLTLEDFCIYGRQAQKWGRLYGMSTLELYQPADHLDAELMFGLGARGCAANEICVAELFAVGCVIHNGLTRVAIRGYEGQYGDPRDDITYFA
jgi:hypothetical protein